MSQFSPQISFSNNLYGVNQVYPVDLDLDGDLDVLASSEIDGKVVWFENFGSGIFSIQKTITDQTYDVRSIFHADFDNDGDDDVVALTDLDGLLTWYKNMGSGVFEPQPMLGSTEPFGRCVYAMDVDDDGDSDILKSAGGNITLFLNSGTGIFDPPQIISNVAGGTCSLYGSDLDGDGDKELLGADWSGDDIIFFENLGLGNFGPKQIIYSLADQARSVYAGDLDGDGDQDVISASSYDNTVAWYENLGGLTFSSEIIISSVCDDVRQIIGADMDSDGDLDVLAAAYGDDNIYWYENNGVGNFGVQIDISPHPIEEVVCIAVVDFEGDGDLDIFSSANFKGNVGYHINQGTGVFSREILVSPHTDYPKSMCTADIDGDGFLDVITASLFDDKIAWFKNYGENDFGGHYITNQANGANSVASADIDGDGDMDVISASYIDDKIALYKNLGGGIFGPQIVISAIANGAYEIHLADIDSDGDIDVVSASEIDNKIAWYRNLGGGNFSTQIIISNVANGVRSIYSADLDNDGDDDLIALLYGVDEIVWYENFGSGSFSAKNVLWSAADNCDDVHAADLDSDGNIDIVYPENSGDAISWNKNLGGGTFAPRQVLISTNGPWHLTSTDMDNDNDADLIVALYGQDKVVWYENLGFGLFGPAKIVTEIQQVHDVHCADFDNDGDNDVLSLSYVLDLVCWNESFYYNDAKISGRVFFDVNQDSTHDSSDIGLYQVQLTANPAQNFTFSNIDGYFTLNLEDTLGNYILQPQNIPYWNIVTDSLSYVVKIDTLTNIYDSLDFGLYPDTLINDIETQLTGSFPMCNEQSVYWLSIFNKGTTIVSGTIHLQLDDSITFVNSTMIPDSINGQNYYWHYDSLFYFSQKLIGIHLNFPAVNGIDDSLISYCNVTINDSIGNTAFADSDTLEQILTCLDYQVYKTSTPEGTDSLGYIPASSSWLEYAIEFQNTTADTIVTIIIKDLLDTNLNWLTFTPIASSHPIHTTVNSNGEVEIAFDSLLLPSSTVDPTNSFVFVKYGINIKPGTPAGTSIYNSASIFIDSDFLTISNTEINTLYDCNSILSNTSVANQVCFSELVSGQINDCPSDELVIWNLDSFFTSTGINFNWLADSSGVFELTVTALTDFCVDDTTILIDVIQAPNVVLDPVSPDTLCNYSGLVYLSATPFGGMYSGSGVSSNQFDPIIAGIGLHAVYYTYVSTLGCSSSDSISIFVDGCLGQPEFNPNTISIYPNPFENNTMVYFGKKLNGQYSIHITDILGQIVYSAANINDSQIEIHRNNLNTGVYLFCLTDTETETIIYSSILIIE